MPTDYHLVYIYSRRENDNKSYDSIVLYLIK